jgi:DNA-binding SARP family transcriptional activator/tetratricopeptide (TPR) repeat protein
VLLGDVRAFVDGREVEIKQRQQRCVLAVLLVDLARPVLVDTLVDRVWGERLPKHPRDALYSHVSRLRTALATSQDVRITQRSGGYVLDTDPESVDLQRFRELVADAGRHERNALPLLTEALDLWTGEPFADLDSPWLAATRDVLAGERLAARLDLTDLRLRDGGHSGLVAELTELTAAHPLDERAAAQLMLALYRSGRQRDALRHYDLVRHALADELGVDPSPPLRELHQRILTSTAELVATRPSAPVPRQLPAPPRSFSGRTGELDTLTTALKESGGAAVISAVGGLGGIGKTWLALRWAHEHLDEFPDGQLFVNLRGFDPSGRPTSPETAVRGFLDAFGVDPSAIPTGLEAQSALYRSLVAGKRLLVVLDNASDTAQVTPLLPGTTSAAVLVTSRDRLVGLAAGHGARPLPLDVLAEPEARALLASRLGAERVAAEPDAVRQLVASCAGLPAALGIVAARATANPELPLAVWADELRDTATRLAALDDADPTASLSAVLSWSCTALDAQQHRVFGLLGSAAALPDISTSAVAALSGLPRSAATGALRALERVSLVQRHAADRYRMHDLVGLHAAHDSAVPTTAREEALRGLVDHYTDTAFAGDRLLDPHRKPVGFAATADSGLADSASAFAWFDAEHHCLPAVQRIAVDHGWHLDVWRLAWAMTTYHRRRGRSEDLRTAWEPGLAAADELGDAALQVVAHRNLASSYGDTGRPGEAVEHLRIAVTLAASPADMALLHRDLAMNCERLADYEAAFDHASRSLDLVRTLDNPVWEADALNNLGWFHAQLGRYEEARAHCEDSLNRCRELRDQDGEGNSLDSLAFIAGRTGRHDEAVRHYHDELILWRGLGYTSEQASALDRLGRTHLDWGERDLARATWQEAVEIYRGMHRTAEVDDLEQRLAELSEE